MERFSFHGKKFINETSDVFKDWINTADKAKQLLITNPNVENWMAIEKAITRVYLVDGAFNTYIPKSEYVRYDYDDFGRDVEIYLFTGKKADEINDEELLKVYSVLKNTPELSVRTFAIRNNDKYQYYVLTSYKYVKDCNLVEVFNNYAALFEKMYKNGAKTIHLNGNIKHYPDNKKHMAVISFTV